MSSKVLGKKRPMHTMASFNRYPFPDCTTSDELFIF